MRIDYSIQRQIEFQHIDPGFTQNTELTTLGVFRHQFLQGLRI